MFYHELGFAHGIFIEFTQGLIVKVSSQADKLTSKHVKDLEQMRFPAFLQTLPVLAHPINVRAVRRTFSLKSCLFLETRPNQRDVFLVSRLPFSL